MTIRDWKLFGKQLEYTPTVAFAGQDEAER
jgi:hypothetical protein